MGEILIVEDDADIREDLAALLRAEGYRVSTARNGLEALEYLRTEHLPGLILLDLMMPVMDGWEFRRRMLEEKRLVGVPIVLLSGADNAQEHADALNASEVVKKPINLDRLYATVDRYCSID
jgi:CheY-like chemotaxis protein